MRTQGKVRLQRGSGWMHGHWNAVPLDHEHRLAHFACPLCDRPITCLDTDIVAGEVSLAVRCPYECPIRQGVKLEGW